MAATTTVTARVPEDLDIALEAISLVTGKSVGALVREAVELYLVHNWNEDKLSRALDDHHQRDRDEQDQRKMTAVQALSQSRQKIASDAQASGHKQSGSAEPPR